jgi:SAM-dependent methyltransferase
MTKNQIKRELIKLAHKGELFEQNQEYMLSIFCSSVDKYSEVIHACEGQSKVLDAGCGGGMLLAALDHMGHDCYGCDHTDCPTDYPRVYKQRRIVFERCNFEIDPLPYPDNFFDAVLCGQCLEHFTYSHLGAVEEFLRVLKPKGKVIIDVPNVACFRNRLRLLRGKNITWDYEKHYLRADPIVHNNQSFFPDRHNREFTADELRLLLDLAGFSEIQVRYIKSRRHRVGFDRIKCIGTMVRDLIPSMRKSIIGFGIK